MTEIETAPIIEDEAGWCPTCGQRTAPWVDVAVGPDELRAVLDAIARSPEPQPDARRVEAKGNNTFTSRDASMFRPCGHAYAWRDCWAWFRVVQIDDAGEALPALGEEVCPICLVGEIERGEVVVVNPDEIERVCEYMAELELAEDGDFPF
jgi:hypothetical protein